MGQLTKCARMCTYAPLQVLQQVEIAWLQNVASMFDGLMVWRACLVLQCEDAQDWSKPSRRCSVKWLDNRSDVTSANREKNPILQGGWMGKYSDLAFVFTAKDLLHTYLIHATDTNTLKYSESPKVHRGTRHLKHQTLCRVYKPHWCSYDHPSYRESPEVYIR